LYLYLYLYLFGFRGLNIGEFGVATQDLSKMASQF